MKSAIVTASGPCTNRKIKVDHEIRTEHRENRIARSPAFERETADDVARNAERTEEKEQERARVQVVGPHVGEIGP